MANEGVWENAVGGSRWDDATLAGAQGDPQPQQQQQSVLQTINPQAFQGQSSFNGYTGPMSAQGLPLMGQSQWDAIQAMQRSGGGNTQGQQQQVGSSGPMMQGFNPTYQNHDGYNSQQYADTNTANQLAQYFGGNVVRTQNAPGSPIGPPPQNMINMGSGDPFNAGLVADLAAKYPKAVFDQIMQAQMASSGVGNGYSMVGANGQRSAQESQFDPNVPGGINALGNPGGANLLPQGVNAIGQGQSGYNGTPINGSNTRGQGGVFSDPNTFYATKPTTASLSPGPSTGGLAPGITSSQQLRYTPGSQQYNAQTLQQFNPVRTTQGQGMGTTQTPSYQPQGYSNPLLTSSSSQNNMGGIGNIMSNIQQLRSQYARKPSYQSNRTNNASRPSYYPTFA